MDADARDHRILAILPAWARGNGDPRLLHAPGRRHVVHAHGARTHLLLPAEAAEQTHLLVLARCARVLDADAVLHDDRLTPLPVQPIAVVAADGRGVVQCGHGGAGGCRQCELPPHNARQRSRAPQQLRGAVPTGWCRLLPRWVPTGQLRGASLPKFALALQQLHGRSLAHHDVRIRVVLDLGGRTASCPGYLVERPRSLRSGFTSGSRSLDSSSTVSR